MSILGEKLKAARKAAGLSQKELAEAVGAKHNSVSNWENGLNSPSTNTILELCRVLNIQPNELYGTQPEPDDFTYALYNETKDLTEENKNKILEMAKFFRQQQKEEE